MAHRENENARANGGSRAEGFNLLQRGEVFYDAGLARFLIPDAKRIAVVMKGAATVTETDTSRYNGGATNRPGK